VVEDSVLVFDEGDAKHVEDPVWARKCLTANFILDKSLHQVVACFCVDQILNLPGEIDELLF